MMKMLWLSVALAVAAAALVAGQDVPRSRMLNGGNGDDNDGAIPTVSGLHYVNNSALLQEDAEMPADIPRPYRFGVVVDIDRDLTEIGLWTDMPEMDGQIMRARVFSKGAKSMTLQFSAFSVPEGADLFISSGYMNDRYTSEDVGRNNMDLSLVTEEHPGEYIIIEAFLPYGVSKSALQLYLHSFVHGYRLGSPLPSDNGDKLCNSASCHVDITCSQGNGWEDEKNGVVKIILSGALCSASVIADPEGNRNLLLTAQHCVGSSSGSPFWDAKFKLEKSCSGCSFVSSGVKTASGMNVIYTSSSNDLALIRITGNIPASADVYYNGWTRQTFKPSQFAIIHHPSGDYKKITSGFSNIQSFSNSYKAFQWSYGTIQGGTSGSPWFDTNTRRVMAPTSAVDSCTFNNPCGNCFNKFTTAGKIGANWFGSSGLAQVLSPSNPNLQFMDGSYEEFGNPSAASPSPPPPPPPPPPPNKPGFEIALSGPCIGQVEDCQGNCISLADESKFGDGVCDSSPTFDLKCGKFEVDGGDCAPAGWIVLNDTLQGQNCVGAVADCNGDCFPAPLILKFLADDVCDDGYNNLGSIERFGVNFQCEAFEYDMGDCPESDCAIGFFEDCDGNCFPNAEGDEAFLNGVCDDGVSNPENNFINLACPKWSLDFGNCQQCDGLYDCFGVCQGIESQALLGDGVCNVEFNCQAYEKTEGPDCGICDSTTDFLDCLGTCFPLSMKANIDDGICNNGTNGELNLLCQEQQFDGGDCSVGCEDDEQEDCSGTCYPTSLVSESLGNSVCDDGSTGPLNLFCEKFFADLGDCFGGPAQGAVLSLTASGLTLRVNIISSTEPIAGYEFSLSSSFESFDGKLSQANGFVTSSSTANDKILSVSLTGTSIPVVIEPAVLIEFTFDQSQEGETVCISGLIVSNQFGLEMQTSFVDDDPCATLQSAQLCEGVEGDANGDGIVNILDIISLVESILIQATQHSPCEVLKLDANSDALLNIQDILIWLITIVN